MKKVIKCLYLIYVILFLDFLLEDQVFNVLSYYAILYAGILTGLFFYTWKARIRKKEYAILKPLIFFLLLLIYTICRPLTNLTVYMKMISLILILIGNFFFFKKYDLFEEILEISVVVPSLFITWRFLSEGAPMEVYSKLDLLFEAAWNERYRVLFGTYHPNAIGNVSACAIMLSFVLLSVVRAGTALGKMKVLLILLLDFVNITVLLSTGSRTSILTVVLCVVVFFFFRVTLINNKIYRMILRTFLFLMGAAIILATQMENIISLFVSSLRYENFVMNLPLLSNPFKAVFGLGLIDASDFGTGATGLGRTFYVDNYYLYVTLTMGLAGLVTTVYMQIKYLRLFWKESHYGKNLTAVFLFSVFIGHLFSGLGESCFLHYAFPSSILYFSCYLAYLSRSCSKRRF